MNRRQLLVQKQFLNNEKAVIKRLEYIYDQSLSEINDKIRNLEFAIGDLREEYDWMDPNDPKRAQVKSMIQAKIYQKQYQQVLQDQVGGILKQMQTKQFLTVSDYLDTCYEDGFIGSLFDLHGQDVPMMMPLDQEAMVRAVQLDSKISKGLYTKLGEDVGVLKKRITSEVTRSIATGVSFEQTAQRLAGQTKIGYNKAVRIARTEGHRIQTSATMDVMRNAKNMGADVVKQWDATLDGKTRESHAAVDGEIREVDEPFSNGLDFPGDPNGVAGEVINCRCALLQRARWALGDGFTKMDNFTKQLETFDSPQKYDEFKTGFFSDGNVKYMNYVQQMQEKYGTRDFTRLLSQMTTREYNHYSKLLANNPVYNTKAKPSFKEQIQTIKDRVNKAGHVTEADLHEAGKLVKDARGLDARNAEAQKVYDELSAKKQVMQTRIDELQKQIDELTDGAEWDPLKALMEPESGGYTNLDAKTLEKIKELRKQIDGIKDDIDYRKINGQLFEARKNLHLTGKESAQNLFDVLSEIRPMGHEKVERAIFKSRSPVRPVVVDALSHYPTSWIEKVLSTPLSVKKVDRGYFSRWENLIAISGYDYDDMLETAYHELGHCFEHKVTDGAVGLWKIESEFYNRRTTGEELKWLGASYAKSEKTRVDNFIHPYIGKDYGGKDFELVSMGFEYAYTNPDNLARDPDMESWIYGILALLD